MIKSGVTDVRIAVYSGSFTKQHAEGGGGGAAPGEKTAVLQEEQAQRTMRKDGHGPGSGDVGPVRHCGLGEGKGPK